MADNKSQESVGADHVTADNEGRRVSFESLRERTDELELLISGISLLALLALPNWLVEHWSRASVHVDDVKLAVIMVAFPLAIGLSYTLAAAFLLHLVVRAYWVGLIGLKSVFSRGIRWERLDSLGPIARELHQERVVELGIAINAADRLASVIFATISLVALSILSGGLIMVGILLLSVLSAYVFHLSPTSVRGLIGILFLSFVGLSLTSIVLDRGAAMFRKPGRKPSKWLRSVVRALLKTQSLFGPQRLTLPLQLSLESNLPRRSFSIIFMVIIVSTVMIGVIQPRLAKDFAPFGSYTYLTDDDVDSGVRSASYENLRSEGDRLLRVPVIPSDLIADAYLRVFLPYLPNRDNFSVGEDCADATVATTRHACLKSLWSIRLDEVEIDVSPFLEAERRDLGMRGLQGYLSMAGLHPGAHELAIKWKPRSVDPAALKGVDYRIPFWFAPPYQLDLVPEHAVDSGAAR